MVTTANFFKGIALVGVLTAAVWALTPDDAQARRCSPWSYSGNYTSYNSRCPGGLAWYRIYVRQCRAHLYGVRTQTKRVWAGCTRR